MDLRLNDKVVIVTGGTGGIGRGLTTAFAAEGAAVVVAARDVDAATDIAAATDGTVTVAECDVTDPASVREMVDLTRQTHGPVDVLVNNAGGATGRSKVAELTAEHRTAQIRLNIDGVVNCTQAVAPDMLGRGSGSVVNISSNASLSGEAAEGCVHYGGCKAFVNAFSRGLAWEWGPAGVRVNVISPGWIVPHDGAALSERSIWRDQFGPTGRARHLEAAATQGSLPNISTLPIRRVGRPEDVAHLALFLASDVSSYITGQLVSVSGGAVMPS